MEKLEDKTLRKLIYKSTMANLVAATLAVSGMAFFIYTGDSKGVMFGFGAAVGYLMKEVKESS